MIDIQIIASSSAGNCYRVSDGKTALLLELGLSFSKIRERLQFKTSEIKAALVSHEHMDHAAGVKDAVKKGMDVHLSRGTAEALKVKGHRIHHIKAMQSFQISTWSILPFNALHDAAEPLGFVLENYQGERLLFLTDSAGCDYFFNNITHMIIEANFSYKIIARGNLTDGRKKRLAGSHMSIEEVVDYVKKSNTSLLQEIHLIHLSDDNSDEASFKQEMMKAAGVPVYVARK